MTSVEIEEEKRGKAHHQDEDKDAETLTELKT